MKKVLILIVFIALPIVSFSQNDTVSIKESITVETVATETEIKTEVALSAEAKQQVLDLNYKKSNELISIKAYRKSLQIKTKEIKTC